jgi:hypothetical protein
MTDDAASLPVLFVLAGHYSQAENWVRQHLDPRRPWTYIHRDTQLAGHRGFPFVRVGSWYERADLDEVEQMLAEREAVEVTS